MNPTELFLTVIAAPVCCSIIMLIITHKMKKFQAGWTLYEEEKKKSREQATKAMETWQGNICSKIGVLSGDVKIVKDVLADKVSYEQHKEVELKVDDYGERVVVLEVKVKDIRSKIFKNDRDKED